MPGRMVWIDQILNADIASGGTLNLDVLVDFTNEATRLQQMTLMRTIIRIDLAHTVHDSGEGSQQFSVGLGVMSQEGFAAGSVPDAEIRGDFPTRGWIYRGLWRVFGFAADQPAVSVRPVDVDLRLRRKLENGLCFSTFHNAPLEGTAATVKVNGIIRTLWLVS